MPRLRTPLIEPDGRISRIRPWDKTLQAPDHLGGWREALSGLPRPPNRSKELQARAHLRALGPLVSGP